MNKPADRTQSFGIRWLVLLVMTVLSAYFLILMEWLFFVTKQSFMSNLTVLERVRVLWISPLAPAVAGVGAVIVLFILAWIIRKEKPRRILELVALAVPALIFTGVFFLVIDNFTYTIFRFGVKTTIGYQGFVYGVLVLALAAYLYQSLYYFRERLYGRRIRRVLSIFTLALLIVSLTFAVQAYEFNRFPEVLPGGENPRILKPHIIILASDGLNAEHMSAYGYHRDTTPFIKQLSRHGLLCENCFANADCSGGSIASMFTGKLPTRTRMLYPPDILRGDNAYQHLPGILKKLGYRNMDVSMKHYADPYDLNMRDSFDMANRREVTTSQSYLIERMGSLLGQEPDYFLYRVHGRLTDRLEHAFCIDMMEDAYTRVTDGGEPKRLKRKRYQRAPRHVEDIISFIDQKPGPVFAHIHLLGTHGPKFSPGKRRFSKGKGQSKKWMDDFYDDAILEFDSKVRKMVDRLMTRISLNNTILVICTDHGQKFTVDNRIPLIFVFPGGEHRGRIKNNVQNMDIAATILDYMNVEQPRWMGGQSLISDPPDSSRVILTACRKHGIEVRGRGGLELDGSKTGPPFYSLGSMGAFYRDMLFRLELEENVLTVSRIAGHTSPCLRDEIPDPLAINRLIIDHLDSNGYDTSSLQKPPRVVREL